MFIYRKKPFTSEGLLSKRRKNNTHLKIILSKKEKNTMIKHDIICPNCGVKNAFVPHVNGDICKGCGIVRVMGNKEAKRRKQQKKGK
jgi:hypothetical protein